MSTSFGSTDPSVEQRFLALHRATYGDLLRFVTRRTNPNEAEDVVSEVFAVAWRRLDVVPVEPDQARAWLFGVAHRLLLRSYRVASRREALTIRIADAARTATGNGPHQHEDADDPDLIARRLDISAAWHRLPPVDQEAISLAVWDGLSGPEAALVLGITPTAFRLRLSRARKALRRELGTLYAVSDGPDLREGAVS